MKHDKQANYFDVVRTEEWRRRFLDQLIHLPGVEPLFEKSREMRGVDVPRMLSALKKPARELIQAYPREELATARQFYNNEHLVDFWKEFNKVLDKLAAAGAICRDFPVFEVKTSSHTSEFAVRAIPEDEIAKKIISKISDQPLRYRWEDKPGETYDNHRSGNGAPAHELLDFLLGKLTWLHVVVSRGITTCYDLFIDRNKSLKGITWDYYRIHIFLDNFFYIGPNDAACRSSFDYVFFNTNACELTLFLKHHFSNHEGLSLSDVDDFLLRQRKYYLKRAITIPLNEAIMLNHRKDLLRYDERQGIVTTGEGSEEARSYFERHTINVVGFVKLQGCPFAKSIGVERNALLEVYEFFDRLTLRLLARIPEFDRLFATQSHRFRA